MGCNLEERGGGEQIRNRAEGIGMKHEITLKGKKRSPTHHYEISGRIFWQGLRTRNKRY